MNLRNLLAILLTDISLHTLGPLRQFYGDHLVSVDLYKSGSLPFSLRIQQILADAV